MKGAFWRVWPVLVLLLPIGCGNRTARPDQTVTGSNALPNGLGPTAFFDEIDVGSGLDFTHRNGASGTRYLPETMGSGGCVLDFDRDGWMDVYLVQSGEIKPGLIGHAGGNRLFRNDGKGGWQDVTQTAGVGGWGYGQGAVAADYNGDGFADIYVTNFGENLLFQNRGDGTFTEIAVQAGVADPSWSSSATFFDGDGDGDLDLYVVNYLVFSIAGHRDCGNLAAGLTAYCHPDVYAAAPDRYYQNQGNGGFVDMTTASGLTDTTGKGLGVVAEDFDNDGDMDLYIANDSTPNFLFINDGGGHFEDQALFLGVGFNGDGQTEAGMGVDSGDLNGDGYVDLFITNLSLETNALYLGGSETFSYTTPLSGLGGPSLRVLGFGTDLADWDNDGDLDIFVANGDVIDNIAEFNDGLSWRQPSQLFLNNGNAYFLEMAGEALGGLAEPRVARGSLTLDFDNNGTLDLLVCYNNDRARLFRNAGAGLNWIGFELRDRAGCATPAGARVRVSFNGRQVRESVKCGSGYLAGNDPRLHFGLGTATAIDQVEILWPSGEREVYGQLAGQRYYLLVQGMAPRVLP